MFRTALCTAALGFVALIAGQAFAWDITQILTVTPEWGVDGRIYMPDSSTLVPTGALVQIIIDMEGDGFDDPREFFDANHNGVIDAGTELGDVAAWVNAGALPLDDDVLAAGPDFDGTVTLFSPGEVYMTTVPPYFGFGVGVTAGCAGAQFGWRAWNLTPDEMAVFCSVVGQEVWYTDCAEIGLDGLPWTITQMEFWMWDGNIGTQVYYGLKDQNVLDRHLATCVPEPGTVLLIGGTALLLVPRRKK